MGQDEHWSECGRAASVANADALSRLRRSVPALPSAPHTVKAKRVIILGVLAVLVVAWLVQAIPNVRHHSEWKRIVAAFQTLSWDRVDPAIQKFAQDRKATNGVVPPTVSLYELVSSGYLPPQDAEAFAGAPVVFHTVANENFPELIRAETRLSDGQIVLLLIDGGIQAVSHARYRALTEQQDKPASQPTGPAGEGRPGFSRTN